MAQKSTANNARTTQVKTTQSNNAPVMPPQPEPQEDSGSSFGRVVENIVHGFALVAITLLTFRFFLLLFGASTSSAFVRFIYRSSEVVMAPFRGIFPSQVSEDSVHYLDFSALFAIVAYALLAYWMKNLIKRSETKARNEETKARNEQWEAQQRMMQSSTTTTTTTKRNQSIQ